MKSPTRFLWAAVLAAAAAAAHAEPPKAPPEVPAKAGEVVTFDVRVEPGKELGFQPAFAPAACVLVRLYSDDPSVYSFLAQPKQGGAFSVVWWTVGEKKGGVTTIGGGTAPPPTTPPADPPATPPPAKPASLYFLVVRPDGPAAPSFTKVMGDPAWGQLRAAGHKVADKTATDAKDKLGVDTAGATLPVVVTLRVDGAKSVIVRPAAPLPTTTDAISRLPEGL